MPELPEAEVVCRQLRPHLRGKAIQSIWIGRDDIVRVGLNSLPWYEGAQIVDVERLGKSVVLACMRNGTRGFIVAELGMTGLLLLHRESAPSEQHIHAMIRIHHDPAVEVYYWNARRFGRLSLFNHEEWGSYRHRRFGIDPLNVSEDTFVSLIQGCRGRIKSLLLHQQKIAGIGNIYANEMLFRAGIHPHAHGNRLSRKRIRWLFKNMQEVFNDGIRLGGSSIRDFLAPDGTPGQFQNHHQVYQKKGESCPHGCPTSIRRLVTERSSFFCPTCQKH